MVTYEQAKEKALKARNDINAAKEYDSAYLFYNSKAKGNEEDDNEVLILKSNGERISMTEYIVKIKDSSKPRKIKF